MKRHPFQLYHDEGDALVSQNVIASRRSLGGALRYSYSQEGEEPLKPIRPLSASSKRPHGQHSFRAIAVALAAASADPRERLGTAQKRQGLDTEAEQSYQQSRELHKEQLEAGDSRVVPLFEQAAKALEAGGRAKEAEELRKKIQYYAKRTPAG